MKILTILPFLTFMVSCNYEITWEVFPNSTTTVSMGKDSATGEFVPTGYEIIRGRCETGKKRFESKDEFCESLRSETGADCETAALAIRGEQHCDEETHALQEARVGTRVAYRDGFDSPQGEPFSYNIATSSCSTGWKDSESKDEFCDNLRSTSFNDGCAPAEREALWLRVCGSNYHEAS